MVLGEELDIATGDICIPASLKVNNLGEIAVLHFPLPWPGLCQSQPMELHLTLLMSSSQRLLIIHSPQVMSFVESKLTAGETDSGGKN
jgi:hypothetical protein